VRKNEKETDEKRKKAEKKIAKKNKKGGVKPKKFVCRS